MEFSAYPDAGAGPVGMEAEYSIAFDFYAAFQRTHTVYEYHMYSILFGAV